MKTKVSLSFVALCAVVLLSLSSILGVFSTLLGLFTFFAPLRFLSGIARIIFTLLPVALVVLLFLREKKDIKQYAYLTLLIGGITILASVVLSLFNIIRYGLVFMQITFYFAIISDIFLGVLTIFSALAIKNGSVSAKHALLARISLVVQLVVTFLSLAVLQFSEIGSSFATIMLILGIATFPKAVIDHDHCRLVTKNLLIGIAAVIIFLLIIVGIANGIANSSSGSSSYSSNTGNSSNSSSQRCFNCGGDGWDSANNCSCVWCGGDGRTSWNP